MKKLLALVLVAVMVFAFVSCGEENTELEIKPFAPMAAAPEVPTEGLDYSDIKFGLICLHDENSTYDKNFIEAFKKAVEELGLKEEQTIIKTNIPESAACYDAAKDLVNQGCNIIFANSFGHEEHILKAATEFKDVQFCHATGVMAHTAGVENFHNAFASIYEGRFLAGVAAGMKLNEMIEAGKITEDQAVMGYVGAHPYEEVKSGYTSFYLGAKYVCPSVTMKVQFTDSWYDETKEKATAEALIAQGCVLISQHADSMGAPTACEKAGVPNVSYNGSTEAACPNTFIVSSRIDWAPYYKYIVNCVASDTKIPADWTGTIATGSVVLTDVNEKAAAPGTVEKIAEVQAMLEKGDLHVFDIETFTVDGKKLESSAANVDFDEKYTPDTEVIADGYFRESECRSAPYFGLDIDGIEVPN
ncbi:MAG: BMP family ABC transporter substrate-binding protein [Clostridia bacterium]|nr:BMP family ABC transporter substrate-binding protein [Clostridia bacterium]